ncbi:MAG: zinc ribbon domain-containing protein [Chloroflexota bacterium]
MTPIYEYECRACGEETEKIQRADEKPLRKCPACGALKLRRKVSRSAFHLKGAGWYATGGYGSNGGAKKEAAECASGSGGSDEKKTETKAEAKAEAKAETKPGAERKAEAKPGAKSEAKTETKPAAPKKDG